MSTGSKVSGFFGFLFAAPIGIAFALGTPVTFILGVIDTWNAPHSVVVKLLINITLDAFLASIWPLTWAMWAIFRFTGHHTPLDLLFGSS